jgi:hypothetical protein
LAVHHHQKKALEFFSREIAAAGTGMGECEQFNHITVQRLPYIS